MQKTAYERRISDWSSDVCSSDLTVSGSGLAVTMTLSRSLTWRSSCSASTACAGAVPDVVVAPAGSAAPSLGAGAASDRKSVVEGKSVAVRVDSGGRRIIKIKGFLFPL